VKFFFLLWMLLYLAHALYSNRNRETERIVKGGGLLMAAVQFPLAAMSVYYALVFDALNRDLLNLPVFILGLLCGQLMFAVSLLATHQNARDTLAHLCDFAGFWRFLKRNPDIIMRFASVSVMEELIYRVAAQNILFFLTGRPALSILLVAAAFAVVHWHFFRNPPVQSLEFAGFSVFLGAAYYFGGSLLFVIVVHTLRNLNIVYVEYLLKEEELGGADQAQAALDEEYRPRKLKAV